MRNSVGVLAHLALQTCLAQQYEPILKCTLPLLHSSLRFVMDMNNFILGLPCPSQIPDSEF